MGGELLQCCLSTWISFTHNNLSQLNSNFIHGFLVQTVCLGLLFRSKVKVPCCRW